MQKIHLDDSDSGQTDQPWMDFRSPVDGASWQAMLAIFKSTF